jgi:hypothetical protein
LIELFVTVTVPPPINSPPPKTDAVDAAIALFDALFEIVVFVMLNVPPAIFK